jgi:erythromycin esterase-like protein
MAQAEPVLPVATLDELRLAAQPLTDGEAGDYDGLLELISNARMALLGVPSYGTHEFLRARAELTKRLIQERGFTAVAVGTDLPALQRVDDFVRGRNDDPMAVDALADFTDFPRWVWRNAELLDFVGWLRDYNDRFSGDRHKVGIVRLDGVIERPEKTVVWGHSRVVGDARATDLNQPSLGQLAREWHGRLAVLVGFCTYVGTLFAASDLDLSPRRQSLRPPRRDSVEALCHAVEIPRFYLGLRDAGDRLIQGLRVPRLERMLGAVYQPHADDASSYVRARLADQLDALVYFDETRSLEPLDSGGGR